MKVTRSRFRPQFEGLEDRLAPSVTNAIFSRGTLTVVGNNASTVMTLTATAPNTWTLASGSTIGFYAGVSNINIRLGNASDSITINPTAASGTNFNVFSGFGTDTVNFGAGTLGGRVVVAAYGGGTINVASTLNGQVALIGSSGAATTLNVGATGTLNGVLTASRVTTVSIAAGASLNNVNLSNGGLGLDTTYTQAAGSTVRGNLTIVGGSGTNTATIAGSVLGNAYINSIYGSGVVNMTGGTVNGTFTYYGGHSTNSLTTSAASTFNSNVNVVLGNGVNTFTMPAFTIRGNLSIAGGNGTNDLGTTFGTAASTIDGNLTVRFGNGTNTFTASALLVIHGSTVSYTGGTGADTVTVSSAPGSSAYNLRITLGGAGVGTDTANLGGLTAADPLGNIIVTFATFGLKSWTPPPVLSYVSLIVNNFP